MHTRVEDSYYKCVEFPLPKLTNTGDLLSRCLRFKSSLYCKEDLGSNPIWMSIEKSLFLLWASVSSVHQGSCQWCCLVPWLVCHGCTSGWYVWLSSDPEASQMGAILDAGAGHPQGRRAQEEKGLSFYLPLASVHHIRLMWCESTSHQTYVNRDWFKHPQAPSTTLMIGTKDVLILMNCLLRPRWSQDPTPAGQPRGSQSLASLLGLLIFKKTTCYTPYWVHWTKNSCRKPSEGGTVPYAQLKSLLGAIPCL